MKSRSLSYNQPIRILNSSIQPSANNFAIDVNELQGMGSFGEISILNIWSVRGVAILRREALPKISGPMATVSSI